MLIGDVCPTTLDGIKSLATQIRKEKGIKHTRALDLAAKAANYSNFRNAQRVLRAQASSPAQPYVLLTMYWHDREQRRRGRETLKVNLLKPVLEICKRPAFKGVRGFGGLRMVADDHFVCDTVAREQIDAHNQLCTAERSLRFMEHTGLRPCRDYRKAYLNGSITDKLPYSDHSTYWIDPGSEQFILVDEPYELAPDQEDRAAWADRNGWLLIKTSWPGMYNPYNCDLYVATNDTTNYNLDALAAKIEAMPAPLLASDWAGESSLSWDTYVSPMAKTAQDVRRARCRGTIYPVASAKTVPYSYGMGSSLRRPAGEMGIEGHIEVGRIIKAIVHSKQRPYTAYNRLNSVRATLEDWMSLEIGRGQLEGPEFFDVYYHETDGDAPFKERACTRPGVLSMLEDMKQKLQAAYPDCAPLRKQLHRIDMAASLINRMKPVKN
jgi:hypothetical protein